MKNFIDKHCRVVKESRRRKFKSPPSQKKTLQKVKVAAQNMSYVREKLRKKVYNRIM